MKKVGIGALIALLALLVVSMSAMAQEGKVPFKIIWSNQAEDVQGPDEVYELTDYGLVCVVDNGQLWCGCPCTNCPNGVQTVISNGTPPPFVPTLPPPPTVNPTEPPKPPKQGCNQGLGNGPDGCSPGNSDNNQQPNDEPGGGRGNGKGHDK